MIGVLLVLAIGDASIVAAPGLADGVRVSVHIALTIAGFAVAARRGPIGIGAGMVGLLGPVGLLLAHGLARRRRTPTLPSATAAATDGQPADAGSIGARMLDGRLHNASAEKLGSLVTVLRHGNVTARRRAVETVVRSFEPALSPLIARALADRDQTIRALAAAAAARVSRNLTQGRAALALRADRGDARAADALVAMLADHARSNVLLSDTQRAHLRRDVLALLRDRPGGAADTEALETALAEAAWSAGDFTLIDEVAERGRATALAWWRTECRA
jgi:uncharacterized Ntn-hydrolase superfamily protein